MATHIGIGFSQKLDAREAAYEAAEQAKVLSGQTKIDIAIIFSTVHYNPNEILPIVLEAMPDAQVTGCSTAGIFTSHTISLHGIGILAITSDDAHFAISSVENIHTEDLRMAGNHLARNAIKDYGDHRRQAFIYFADGLLSDNSLILQGLQDVFGNIFPIVGAGSSDDFHFKASYQFAQEKIMSHSACGFLMGGDLTLGIGNRHGWKPLGKPRFADKVEGNIIKLIDGKPAANIYDEYFAEEAANIRTTKLGQMSILYPLGIYIKGEDEYLLRNAVHILDDGSIVCQGQVPNDSEIHVMIANKESCIQAAADAAMAAQHSLMGKEAKLVIIFESLARHKLLSRAAFQEIKTIKDIFGYTTPIIGMYSYGEICPSKALEDLEKIYLQNESIAILAIG